MSTFQTDIILLFRSSVHTSYFVLTSHSNNPAQNYHQYNTRSQHNFSTKRLT